MCLSVETSVPLFDHLSPAPKPALCHLQESKRQKKTLKKTRKFMVDGVEVSVTTSKIVTDNDAKNEEMRFLRYVRIQSTRRTVHTE